MASSQRAPSPAIDGLIKEANETAGEIEDKAVLDAAIVANSQSIEHYEISRYGTLIAWAEELGHDDVVRLLTTNLNEERPQIRNSIRLRSVRASTRRRLLRRADVRAVQERLRTQFGAFSVFFGMADLKNLKPTYFGGLPVETA